MYLSKNVNETINNLIMSYQLRNLLGTLNIFEKGLWWKAILLELEHFYQYGDFQVL